MNDIGARCVSPPMFFDTDAISEYGLDRDRERVAAESTLEVRRNGRASSLASPSVASISFFRPAVRGTSSCERRI